MVKHSPPSKPGRGLHIAQRDESGAPVRMAGTVTDITERKSAEDRLRTSEAELRVPFESMTDLIFVFDFEGRYLKVAPTNPSLLYRPAPELLGKKLHEVLPRERADEFLAYIRRALETQRSVNLHGGHLWHARRVRGRCAESLPGRGRSPTLEAVRTRQPVLRRDVRRFLLAEPLYAPIHRFAREVSWDTVYIVPLVYKGRALGAINLRYLLEQEPGEDEKVFLKTVADQTAVAVENARLLRVDHSLVARLPDHMRH